MDDTNGHPQAACGLALFILAALCVGLSGCSFFVMGGKMLFGDPQVASAFRRSTGEKLTGEERKVLVVCSASETIKMNFPSITFDVTDGLIRRMKLRGIDVVKPDKVADWIDDRGGSWSDPSQLAAEFHPDYIIYVEIEDFSTQEENSTRLHRGKAHGSVFAYRVEQIEGQPEAQEIFVHEFSSTYPQHYPISADRMSATVFRQRHLDRLCDQLGQLFYDYSASEQIE